MRVKDCYSLRVEDIFDEMPPNANLPSRFDGGINPIIIRGNCEDSLNIFQAFANYIVERNRTRDMERQFKAAENALDARNDEARRQSAIIIDNYAERLNAFLEAKRQELELETQRLLQESAAQVEQIQNEREREHARITELTRMIEFYRSYLDEAQNFLAEVEDSPEKFVTKNKFYYQIKEDCRVKIKWIRNLLKKIDNR